MTPKEKYEENPESDKEEEVWKRTSERQAPRLVNLKEGDRLIAAARVVEESEDGE